jgi:hypothetical protein
VGGDDHEQARGLLAGRDALLADGLGETGLGDREPVLHADGRELEIGAQLEGDGERVGAVVGGGRGHVEHALDAVDLLLEGGADGLGDDARIGARVDRADLDGGRGDLGVLLDGELGDGEDAHQHHDDRDDAGEDGAVDEEA